MGIVAIVAGLVLFGALVGRWWALLVVGVPFVLLELWLVSVREFEDHDFGTFAGSAVAAGLVPYGLGALIFTAGGIGLRVLVRDGSQRT